MQGSLRQGRSTYEGLGFAVRTCKKLKHKDEGCCPHVLLHLALKGEAFGSYHLQIGPMRSWVRPTTKAWKVKAGTVFSPSTEQSPRPSAGMKTTSPEAQDKVQYKPYSVCRNNRDSAEDLIGRKPQKKNLTKQYARACLSLNIQSFIDIIRDNTSPSPEYLDLNLSSLHKYNVIMLV